MNRTQSKQSAPASFRLATILAVFIIGLVAANVVSHFLLNREIRRGRRLIVSATQNTGPDLLLVCHEGGDTPHYDFLLNYAKEEFTRVWMSGNRSPDLSRPVKCTARAADTQEISARLEALPPKPEGRKRLIVIGDSFTAGEGVQQGNAFPETMQRRLSLFGNSEKWDIINFGRIGHDFPALYDDNFKNALAAHPDEILYVWIPNDTPARGLAYPDEMGLSAHYNSPEYVQSLRGLPLSRLISVIVIKRRISSQTLKWYRTVHGPDNKKGLDELRDYIGRMKREAAARGAAFRMALFPLMIGRPGRYPLEDVHGAVANIARAQGVPVLDLTDKVLVRPVDELRVHERNYHPNTAAHRLAATALLDWLKLQDTPRREQLKPPGMLALRGLEPWHKELARGLAAELEEYPDNTVFNTDSKFLKKLLSDNYKRKAKLLKSAKAAPDCAPGAPCVRIRLVVDKKHHFRPAPHCAPQLHYGAANVMFCVVNP